MSSDDDDAMTLQKRWTDGLVRGEARCGEWRAWSVMANDPKRVSRSGFVVRCIIHSRTALTFAQSNAKGIQTGRIEVRVGEPHLN